MTTVNHPCLARLTSWEDSNYEVSPKKSVSYLTLCKRVAEDDKYLCSICEKRPRTLKEAQARAKKNKQLCLDLQEETPVYCVKGGLEFQAVYRNGTLELEEKQPATWPSLFPRTFTSPPLFVRMCARVVEGLDKNVYVRGWQEAFVRSKQGDPIPLEKFKSEGSEKEAIHPQTLLLHGTLTEPAPASCLIYGTPGYLAVLGSAKTSEQPSERWIKKAQQAEQEAEGRCKAAGKVFWKASVPISKAAEEEGEEDGMPPRKKGSKAEELPQQKNTILKSFPKITKHYQESADPPKKLPTDSQEIWKEECEGQMYWFSESGWIFSVEDDGEPGEICGKMDAEGNIELYVE